MQKETKAGLAVLIGILTFCLIGGVAALVLNRLAPKVGQEFLEQTVVEDREEAAAVGQDIAGYTLPAGYQEAGAMQFAGFRTVIIEPESYTRDHVMIMMMQIPSGGASDEATLAEMERAMRQQAGQQAFMADSITEETVNINDEDVLMTIMDDVTGNRQIQAVFAGNHGPVMLMITGQVRNWDQEAVDDFIKSLH